MSGRDLESPPEPGAGAPATPAAAAAGGPERGLRVRPPSPIPTRVRFVLAAVAVVLAVIGAALVVSAQSDDGGTHPGAAWDGHPLPPRGASIDPFDLDGPLGPVDGFGTWDASDRFSARGGVLEAQPDDAASAPGAPGAFATVDAGSSTVLVFVQVLSASPGSGIVVSSSSPGTSDALVLVAGDGSWALDLVDVGGAAKRLASFPAPTSNVAVQVVRRGSEVDLQFDTKAFSAALPPQAPSGTLVGLAAGAGGARFDLFGYLPLPAG